MRHAHILIIAAVALFLLAGAVARADENPCTATGIASTVGISTELSNTHAEIPNATGGSITPDRQGTGVYGQRDMPAIIPTEAPLVCGTLTVAVVSKVARTCANFVIDYLDANGKVVWSTSKLTPVVDAVSDPSTCTYNTEKIPTNRKLLRSIRFAGDPQTLRDRGIDPAKFAIPGRTSVYFNGVRKATDRIEIAMHP
jgi:hypothetical protein